MLNAADLNKPKIGGLEQIIDISNFRKLDMGDTRTSAGGTWYEDNANKKRFFIKPAFTWTSDNRGTQPLCLKGSPIMALFLGNIFKILMKGRAPDHWLIKRKNQALIASMFLDNFVTFTKIGIDREYTKIENAKGIHRYLAATIILSNFDTGTGNFGLVKGRVNGIDLDQSLSDCFSSFQGYFNRLKHNAEFSFKMFVWDEDIDLNEVHNKLRNKVNFQKLLDRLDKACDLVEENFDDVKQHLEKQEANFFSLSSLFLEKYENKMYGDRIIFQEKPYVTCYYDKQEKIIRFDDGQTLAEKILSILEKHVEIAKKSSKTLNIATEICQNKTKDSINLIDEYVKSHDEEDVQVGEVSHFLNWLEVNEKIDTNLAVKLKSKYSVSVNDLQNDNVTQPTAPHPLNTSEQQEQPVILNGDNSKKNNDNKFLRISPRGLIIISTIVVGAIIGPVALHLLAISTLGAEGAIMTGIVVGGLVGGVAGYLANVVVDKCFGNNTQQVS